MVHKSELQSITVGLIDPPTSFSFVIITHNRDKLFWEAYHSILTAQKNYGGDVEVIVVNSSPRRLFAEDFSDCQEIHVPNAFTASIKRNLGWQNASNEWVIFMDDDCQIASNALIEITRYTAVSSSKTAAFFGITDFIGDKSYWFMSVEGTDYMESFRQAQYSENLCWGPTSLAVFRRSALAEVGGFDSSFVIPAGGEDVAIGITLREHGKQLRAIPTILVYHNTQTWNDIRSNLRRFFNYGRAELELLKRFPQYGQFDSEAPLLFLLIYLLILIVLVVLRGITRDIILFTAIYLLSIVIAQYINELNYSRKSLYLTLGLILYRFTHKLGMLRASSKFQYLIKRFNGEALRDVVSLSPQYFGASFLIKWGIAVIGLLLWLLVTLL